MGATIQDSSVGLKRHGCGARSQLQEHIVEHLQQQHTIENPFSERTRPSLAGPEPTPPEERSHSSVSQILTDHLLHPRVRRLEVFNMNISSLQP
ncbi:unnamed protein product [Arctogadus glacialis]